MLNCLSFLWYAVNRSQLYHGIHTFYINPKIPFMREKLPYLFMDFLNPK